MRTLYHAGLAHGANHLVTLVTEAMEMLAAAGADDPAGTLRPLLTAALDNALEQGDAALTGPIVRGDVNTVRAHLADIARQRAADAGVVRRAGPRHPRPRRSPTAGCCRSGPPRSAGCSTRPSAPAPPGRRAAEPAADERDAPPSRAPARSSPRCSPAPAPAAGGSPWCRRWAPSTRATPA